MHMSGALIVVAGMITLVVEGQSISSLVAQIPTCALTCLSNSAAVSGCGLTDYECQCLNGEHTDLSGVKSCILKACSVSDQVTTQNLTNEICSIALGVGTTSTTSTPSPSNALSSTTLPSTATSVPTASFNPASNLGSTPSPTTAPSPNTSSPTTPQSTSTSSNPSPAPNKKGIIAGSVVGGVLGLATIIAVAVYFIPRMRARNVRQDEAGKAPAESTQETSVAWEKTEFGVGRPTVGVRRENDVASVERQNVELAAAAVPVELDGRDYRRRA